MARHSVLSPELLSALNTVGAKLQEGGKAGRELEVAVGFLSGLDARHVARADREIADAAGLHRHPPQPLIGRLLSRRPSGAKQLLALPGLEYLFLFHRDGRLREAALLKMTGGLPSPFIFATVLWRLNDWAAPVRQAAARCASRAFPVTAPSVVARTAAELLVRQASWGRWRDERTLLDCVFGRDDVAAHLAKLIAEETTGPQASTLRYALRTPGLDQHLERLARKAVQPSVRAVALNALIDGKAEWPTGTAWQWIDKSIGLRRRVPVFDHRPLSVAVPREALIEQGIADRSAAVRRVALAGVIRHLLGTNEAAAIATPLLQDQSPSVRERAEFILHSRVA